jgi:hypothetical protein
MDNANASVTHEVATTVNGLVVGDFLIGSRRTVTYVGIAGKTRRVDVAREGGEARTFVWNGRTTMKVRRQGAASGTKTYVVDPTDYTMRPVDSLV